MWFPCCCCRYCPHCADGFAPAQWQVDISGLADGACQDCDQLNGSYILEAAGQSPQGGCRWELRLPTPICYVRIVRLTIGPYVAQGWPIVLDLLDEDEQFVLGVTRYYSDLSRCLEITDESLGALSWWFGYPNICDISNSNASITALRPCQP